MGTERQHYGFRHTSVRSLSPPHNSATDPVIYSLAAASQMHGLAKYGQVKTLLISGKSKRVSHIVFLVSESDRSRPTLHSFQV